MKLKTVYRCAKCKNVIYEYSFKSAMPESINKFHKINDDMKNVHKKNQNRVAQRIKSHRKKCGKDFEIDLTVEPE